MGKCVNRVILLGRAGKDPSVHILRTGTIVNVSLATSERYRDIHGDWQEHTEWHNLVGFQRVGEILRDYVRKGSRLYIEGGRPASAATAPRSSSPRSAFCLLRLMAAVTTWSTTSVVKASRRPSSVRNRRSCKKRYRTDS
jgi:hypothetical protein